MPLVCQSPAHHRLHSMSDIAVHDNVILFDDRDTTDLIVVTVFLVLHLLRTAVELLGLNHVPTEHLRILYFDLGVVENVVIVVYVFYYFNGLLLTLFFRFGRAASSLVGSSEIAVHLLLLTRIHSLAMS